MSKFFEVSVKYLKTQDNGSVKAITECYLVDSLSLTEAEAAITEELRSYINGDFFATSAKATKITEVVGCEECGKYFLAKVALLTANEITGAVKRSVMQILVGAEDFDSAYKACVENMQSYISDWEIVGFAESPIVGVISKALN